MSFITFNFEKKHIFLIVGILIYILDDMIEIKYIKKKEKLKINFLNYLSKIFLIFPYLFIIKFLSKNNNINNIKNKGKIRKNIVNLNNIYNFKILPNDKKFRNFIIKLLIFYFFSEIYYNLINFYNSRKPLEIHRYKIALFILIIYFNKIIFKEKFFIHHYLTTVILIIFLLILTINNYIIWSEMNFKFMEIIFVLNDFLALILMSFDIILFKYLIDKCYMNGYLIFFVLGIIQTIISLLIEWNKKYLIKREYLLILLFFFIKNFYFIFFIQKFNPCLFGIIMFGSCSFFYVRDISNRNKNINKKLNYFFKGSFIFSFFFLFIFSENIQFNFCGLNKQTIIKKQILSKIEEKDLEKSVGEINNESNRNSELNLF